MVTEVGEISGRGKLPPKMETKDSRAFGAPVRPMNGVCGEGLDRKAGASRMDAEPAMIWRRVGAGFGKQNNHIAATALYLTLPGRCGLPRKLAAIPAP